MAFKTDSEGKSFVQSRAERCMEIPKCRTSALKLQYILLSEQIGLR